MVNGDELGSVRERAFDLNLGNHVGDAVHHRVDGEDRRTEAHDLGDRPTVANELEDLRGDERDRLGMIQLEAAAATLPRQLAGRKDQQLVDFARRQVHARLRKRESYCGIIRSMKTPTYLFLIRVAAVVAVIAVAIAGAACKEAPKSTTPAASPAAAPAPPPPPKVRVYVTNEASGDLTVINGETHEVVTTAPLGKRPRGIKASPDGKTLYVALS